MDQLCAALACSVSHLAVVTAAGPAPAAGLEQAQQPSGASKRQGKGKRASVAAPAATAPTAGPSILEQLLPPGGAFALDAAALGAPHDARPGIAASLLHACQRYASLVRHGEGRGGWPRVCSASAAVGSTPRAAPGTCRLGLSPTQHARCPFRFRPPPQAQAAHNLFHMARWAYKLCSLSSKQARSLRALLQVCSALVPRLPALRHALPA